MRVNEELTSPKRQNGEVDFRTKMLEDWNKAKSNG
jgi:hypothetical protein